MYQEAHLPLSFSNTHMHTHTVCLPLTHTCNSKVKTISHPSRKSIGGPERNPPLNEKHAETFYFAFSLVYGRKLSAKSKFTHKPSAALDQSLLLMTVGQRGPDLFIQTLTWHQDAFKSQSNEKRRGTRMCVYVCVCPLSSPMGMPAQLRVNGNYCV